MIAAQLGQACPEDIRSLSERFAARDGVLAVLFYGNLLREPGAGGLVDLYVLTESDQAYHGASISALANRLLPPNVYHETGTEGPAAKVAVISLASFTHRMRASSWDTTLWARFSQASVLTYSRDRETADRVLDAIVSAHETAAQWGVRLSPTGAGSSDALETLYRHTYGAELRVESGGRAKMIAEQGAKTFELLHQAVVKTVSAEDRADAQAAWRHRRYVGKTLNFARLLKACFTFRAALPYAISKIERHSGRPVELKRWEARFPWLAAPFVLVRLLRERRLR